MTVENIESMEAKYEDKKWMVLTKEENRYDVKSIEGPKQMNWFKILLVLTDLV